MSYDLCMLAPVPGRRGRELRELNPRLDESVFDGGRATLHRMVDGPEPKKSKWKRLLGG